MALQFCTESPLLCLHKKVKIFSIFLLCQSFDYFICCRRTLTHLGGRRSHEWCCVALCWINCSSVCFTPVKNWPMGNTWRLSAPPTGPHSRRATEWVSVWVSTLPCPSSSSPSIIAIILPDRAEVSTRRTHHHPGDHQRKAEATNVLAWYVKVCSILRVIGLTWNKNSAF